MVVQTSQSVPAPAVIHEDASILVINKPAGLVVHPAAGQQSGGPSVARWLLEHYPDVRGVGDDPARPGIVHRLDKDTSGVMVVARTQKAYDTLKTAFKNRAVHKKYQTLVEGLVPWQAKQVQLSIRRTGSGAFGARHPHDVAALQERDSSNNKTLYREALTNFEVKKRFINATLLEAHPKTGRTHQIRVHLKAIGYPVVGDALYGPKKLVDEARERGLARHFLHAAQLRFVHPEEGREVTYRAALPQELATFLEGYVTAPGQNGGAA